MNVTTWNVNSIRARLDRVLTWLRDREPDVVCLQELKCLDEEVPRGALEALGYHVETFGQKTYNGVAILSRWPLTDVERRFPWPEDEQSRGIVATTNGVRIVNVYVVNGQALDSDKYPYKLKWVEHLHQRLAAMDLAGTLVCGDFNITPADADVYDPVAWKDDIFCSPAERGAFQGLLDLGLTDAFRALHPTGYHPTWWDYRGNMFEQQKGLRIDHFLIGDALRARLLEVSIDVAERGQPQASDHAPVTLHLRD